MTGLTQAAKQSSLMRPDAKITGGADLNVVFKGKSDEAQAYLSSHGIFDKVRIDRGTTGVRASTGEAGEGMR